MTEKKKLLLLGARGRLGKIFIDRHSQSFDILEVGSKKRVPEGGREYHYKISDLKNVFLDHPPDVIVNLAAVWGAKVSEGEIWEAGYTFPAKVLGIVRESKSKVQWIQVDSYYNLYFDLYGVDKDHYSRTKRIFFELLKEKSFGEAPIQVIAPHLVGPSEPPNRFFRVLSDGIFKNTPYSLGSAGKYLPYVHLSDAADQLFAISQAPVSRVPSRVNMRISGQSQLRHIVSQAHSQFGVPDNIARFGALPEAAREFNSPLNFEVSEWLPAPKQQLSSILDEQWNERRVEKDGKS